VRRQRPLLDTSQHIQEIDINASAGIRTRNPSRGAAKNQRFRSRDQRRRFLLDLFTPIILCEHRVFNCAFKDGIHTVAEKINKI
jgi:hypothetical protein